MRDALIIIPLWWLTILASLSAYEAGYVGHAIHNLTHQVSEGWSK